jgi:hypothetical protein
MRSYTVRYERKNQSKNSTEKFIENVFKSETDGKTYLHLKETIRKNLDIRRKPLNVIIDNVNI